MLSDVKTHSFLSVDKAIFLDIVSWLFMTLVVISSIERFPLSRMFIKVFAPEESIVIPFSAYFVDSSAEFRSSKYPRSMCVIFPIISNIFLSFDWLME